MLAKHPARKVRLTAGNAFSNMAHDVDIDIYKAAEIVPGTQSSFVVLPGAKHKAFKQVGINIAAWGVRDDKSEVPISLSRELQQRLGEQELLTKLETNRFYVYGHVSYEDVFGKEWASSYCFYAFGLHDVHFACCTNPEHNIIQ